MADQDSFSKQIPIRVVSVDSNGVPLPAGGSAVTIADNGNAVEGALADAAIITDTTGTINGKIRGLVKWAFERMPASLGQKTMAGSLAVTVASDQTTFPVTASAGTNLNTSALALDATLTGRTQKSQITDGTRDGTVKAGSTLPALTDTATVVTQRDPLPAGTNVIGHAITDSGSVTNATLSAETTKVIGTVNQGTTPWNVGGSNGAYLQQTAGPNNLLKVEPWSAAAQLIGQKTMAGSLPVVLASDQTSIPVAATLSAETTKVIGTTRVIGNAGAVFDAATAAAVPANGLYMGGSDGTNLRGLLTTSAANLTAATTLGAQMVAGPLATWSITHRPAAATKATATKAAGAAGVRHVVTGFSFILVTVGTAQAAALNLDVIDGASGGTTRLWSGGFGGIPVNSQVNIVITGCMLIGTAATALTIEFSAAGVAASFEFVNLQGFSVS